MKKFWTLFAILFLTAVTVFSQESTIAGNSYKATYIEAAGFKANSFMLKTFGVNYTLNFLENGKLSINAKFKGESSKQTSTYTFDSSTQTGTISMDGASISFSLEKEGKTLKIISKDFRADFTRQ